MAKISALCTGRLCLWFCPLLLDERVESADLPFVLGTGGGAVVGGGNDGFEPITGLLPAGLGKGSFIPLDEEGDVKSATSLPVDAKSFEGSLPDSFGNNVGGYLILSVTPSIPSGTSYILSSE